MVRGDGDISNGMINPADDAAVIEMELQLADLATVEKASGKKKRWDADTIAAHEKVLAGLQVGLSVYGTWGDIPQALVAPLCVRTREALRLKGYVIPVLTFFRPHLHLQLLATLPDLFGVEWYNIDVSQT